MSLLANLENYDRPPDDGPKDGQEDSLGSYTSIKCQRDEIPRRFPRPSKVILENFSFYGRKCQLAARIKSDDGFNLE